MMRVHEPGAEDGRAQDGGALGLGSTGRGTSPRCSTPRPGAGPGCRPASALAGGTLSWMVGSFDGPDVIATQDLRHGKVTRMALPEDCQASSGSSALRSNGRQLVANAHCTNRVHGVGGASEQRSMPT